MTVGVLAFHGDFAEHLEILRSLKTKAIEVRSLDDLGQVDHLIIPGGESTVMARFLTETGVGDAIKARVKEGSLAVYGTCAGAILVSRKVTGKNAPRPLGLIDIVVDRIEVKPDNHSRIAESVTHALNLSQGECIALIANSEDE